MCKVQNESTHIIYKVKSKVANHSDYTCIANLVQCNEDLDVHPYRYRSRQLHAQTRGVIGHQQEIT